MHILKMVFFAAAMTSLFACGKGNDEAPFTDHSDKTVAEWTRTHKSYARTATAVCESCHGADLSGGISKVSCMNPTAGCHTSSPVVNPKGCVSCHAAGTTGPNGDTDPNRAGAHAKHLALNGVSCTTCHNGAGYGTALHADGKANILFDGTTFKAEEGTLGYNDNAGTCSAVSCHGGQETPNWYTGSINVATDCLKCHEQGTAYQTPQYNSFYSGKGINVNNLHKVHLLLYVPETSNFIICNNCHSVDKLNGHHFTKLDNHEFETPPVSTIGGTDTNITEYSDGNCTTSCHGIKNWNN